MRMKQKTDQFRTIAGAAGSPPACSPQSTRGYRPVSSPPAGALAAGAGAGAGGPSGRARCCVMPAKFGSRPPDSEADQAPLLEGALRETTRSGAGLHLPPGRYLVAGSAPAGRGRRWGCRRWCRGWFRRLHAPIPFSRARSRACAPRGVRPRGALPRHAAPLLRLEKVADCRLLEIAVDGAAGTAFDLSGCGGLVAQCSISGARIAVFPTTPAALARPRANLIRDCSE